MIPSPLIIICWIRGFFWSIGSPYMIQGHPYEQLPPKPGDSPKLKRLKCITCGRHEAVFDDA